MQTGFSNAKELIALCKSQKKQISDVVIQYEMKLQDRSKTKILELMQDRIDIMRRSVRKGLEDKKRSVSGLSGGDAVKIQKVLKGKNMLMNKLVLNAMQKAIAVLEYNSKLGQIVACPSAGSAGILPGVLLAAQEEFGKSDQEIAKVIFAAAAVGMIASENSIINNDHTDCNAECGIATAMSACALAELRGLKPAECFNAASLALKNLISLKKNMLFDKNEVPCVKKNAICTCIAFAVVDLTSAGIKSMVNFDETVKLLSSV